MAREGGGMPDEKFRIGDWWLDREPGSASWYRYRYEPVQRSVRRRSLRTSDFEAAKLKLAEFVTATAKPTGQPAQAVYLAPVLEQYLTNVTDKKPSKKSRAIARAAGRHVLSYFGSRAKVGSLTKERQREFMRHCADKLGHSVDYISRNLSVVATALHHARLRDTPTIVYGKARIAEILDKPAPGPREWIPTIEAVGRMFDHLPKGKTGENLFRFLIVMLTTGARPEAALDLGPKQVTGRIVKLNPIGRRQNKKVRPTIVAGECLLGWLCKWEAKGGAKQRWDPERGTFIHRKGRPLNTAKHQVKRLAARAGIEGPMHQYAFRHFVATEMAKRRVPKEERDLFLGHRGDSPMTDWYEKFDPSYLANAVAAIDALMQDIQQHTERALFTDENKVVALKLLSKRA
jgi:integrase